MESYALIEQALIYIEQHRLQQPSLREIAVHLGISPFHLQRTFKEWVGISPKRFLQFLTIHNARALLKQSQSVLETAWASGLSGPARLHDLFIAVDAVTPGEFKSLGRHMRFYHADFPTPFGQVLMAAGERGLCFMGFFSNNRHEVYTDMRQRFPRATFTEDSSFLSPYYRSIFLKETTLERLPLFLKGTNFQIKVWEALMRIPEGAVCSYGDLARGIGKPGAGRAVGSAVGANPVSYLIPCHRVIQRMGVFGHYHWGSARKKALLLWEAHQGTPGDSGNPPVEK